MYYSTVWLMPEQLNLKRRHHLDQECEWLRLKDNNQKCFLFEAECREVDSCGNLPRKGRQT